MVLNSSGSAGSRCLWESTMTNGIGGYVISSSQHGPSITGEAYSSWWRSPTKNSIFLCRDDRAKIGTSLFQKQVLFPMKRPTSLMLVSLLGMLISLAFNLYLSLSNYHHISNAQFSPILAQKNARI